MAKQDPFIQSSWKGIDYIKSKPGGLYRLSTDSRRSAEMFTIASPLAKHFRHLFVPILPFPKNRKMQTTFVGAFQKWMKYKNDCIHPSPDDLIYVNHFQFNSFSNLQDRLHVPLQVSGQQSAELLLQIPLIVPAAHIGAPAHTTQVAWQIMAGCCKLKDPVAVDSYRIELTMPYDQTPIAAQSLTLPLKMPEKSVSLVAIAFQYIKSKSGVISVSKDKRWLPCGIVGGWVME